MPLRANILQIFVASPSDVQEERAALEEVVRELNLCWDRSEAVRLDLWRWETNAYPASGSDPQAVINSQAPSDYDIFVGILWARFGTATPRALSGTEEEFTAALSRSRSASGSPRIMIYFKETPLSPSAIDPAQLAALRRFKGNLGPEGILYWPFSSLDSFKALLRVHLRKVVQEFLAQAPAAAAAGSRPASPAVALPGHAAPDDDEGFLDLADRASDAIDRLNQVSARMVATIAALNERTAQRTAEMKALVSTAGATATAAKHVADRAAEDLEDFATQANSDNPIFIEALREFLESFSRAASLSLDFRGGNAPDLSGSRDQVVSMRLKLAETRAALKGLRDMIATAPLTTTAYNRAKRRALGAMDTTLAHFDEAGEACRNAEETIAGLLH